MHSQDSKIANNSLNQLWLLDSLDYCNWITMSYINHCLKFFSNGDLCLSAELSHLNVASFVTNILSHL